MTMMFENERPPTRVPPEKETSNVVDPNIVERVQRALTDYGIDDSDQWYRIKDLAPDATSADLDADPGSIFHVKRADRIEVGCTLNVRFGSDPELTLTESYPAIASLELHDDRAFVRSIEVDLSGLMADRGIDRDERR